MLAFENLRNLERLAVCHVDIEKSKVQGFMQNLLGGCDGRFNHDGSRHAPNIIISRSMAINGSSSTMRMCNIFMERNLGGLLNEYRAVNLLSKERFLQLSLISDT
jgi:hypothetical protein